MGLKSFFHKLKTGFARRRGISIPYVSSIKTYGDNGESIFINSLTRVLPLSQIKSNVVINAPDGNAEIDCLILYQNKLFAIEVKSWKGRLTEIDNDYFIQEKIDCWTDEIHEKYLKSPFKQLNRAIYLLKKQISGKVWINPVVYFVDEEFEGISTSIENIWFDNINNLVNYIESDGELTYGKNEAKYFFDKCISADYLYVSSCGKSLRCIIEANSLTFQTEQGLITRKDISHIHIVHHFSYDELIIALNDGSSRRVIAENGRIKVNSCDKLIDYSLCKLDYIKIGS